MRSLSPLTALAGLVALCACIKVDNPNHVADSGDDADAESELGEGWEELADWLGEESDEGSSSSGEGSSSEESGPSESSSSEEGPIEEGPIEEGPSEEGPIEEGPSEEGPSEGSSSTEEGSSSTEEGSSSESADTEGWPTCELPDSCAFGDLEDCIRITVGSRDENKRLLAAFDVSEGADDV